ncbi:hypothetical protein NL676_036114 [Syzygium grande]|nr:hypothetical protein NL676_036114 [Syzygium grande]
MAPPNWPLLKPAANLGRRRWSRLLLLRLAMPKTESFLTNVNKILKRAGTLINLGPEAIALCTTSTPGKEEVGKSEEIGYDDEGPVNEEKEEIGVVPNEMIGQKGCRLLL